MSYRKIFLKHSNYFQYSLAILILPKQIHYILKCLFQIISFLLSSCYFEFSFPFLADFLACERHCRYGKEFWQRLTEISWYSQRHKRGKSVKQNVLLSVGNWSPTFIAVGADSSSRIRIISRFMQLFQQIAFLSELQEDVQSGCCKGNLKVIIS